jgi:ABC-2 type transport system ATP-binding protein
VLLAVLQSRLLLAWRPSSYAAETRHEDRGVTPQLTPACTASAGTECGQVPIVLQRSGDAWHAPACRRDARIVLTALGAQVRLRHLPRQGVSAQDRVVRPLPSSMLRTRYLAADCPVPLHSGSPAAMVRDGATSRGGCSVAPTERAAEEDMARNSTQPDAGSLPPKAPKPERDGALVVSGLTKIYEGRAVVHELSFVVRPGEIFALLGPNGAGKTTTVEILEGYRAPDTGSVRVLGLDPLRQAAALKPQIGVMLQQDGIYPSLTVGEVLALFAQFFAVPEDPQQLLRTVGLVEAAGTRCRQLSGGQKRRLSLALALVGRPRLAFLDEPTTGMDPQARRATWDIIRGLKERGATVLLTTHLMDEAERLADRIAILDNGVLIALDTPAGLMRGQSTTTTEVYFTATTELEVAALSRLPSARGIREDAPGRYAVDTGDPRALLVELTTWLRDQKVDLAELRVGHSSLEEVFLRLTDKEGRE